jgi:hypothetical protein
MDVVPDPEGANAARRKLMVEQPDGRARKAGATVMIPAKGNTTPAITAEVHGSDRERCGRGESTRRPPVQLGNHVCDAIPYGTLTPHFAAMALASRSKSR